MPRPSILNADVLRAVAIAFDVTVAEMIGPRRFRRIVRARQAAMYLVRTLNKTNGGYEYRYSLPNIGRWYGGRDHSSVHAAISRVTERRTRDPELAGKLEEIEWGLLA